MVMLTDSHPTDQQSSVFAALAARARGTSDSMLVSVEFAGLAAALSIFAWYPRGIALALPFVAAAMFGLWGVAEHARRLLSPSRIKMSAMSIFQLGATVVGAIAAATTLFALLGWAIGTIIS